jgi:hypothetical protein
VEEEPEDMDMEVEASSPDENRKPRAERRGIQLCFANGPCKGQTFRILKGVNETVIVGSNPVPKANESVLKITDDPTVGKPHAKLELQLFRKKLYRLVVTDLKPNNTATLVSGLAIPRGKNRVALPTQTITFGGTQMKVSEYQDDGADSPMAEPEPAPIRRKRSVAAAIDNSPKKAKETGKPARMEVVNENASCKLVVTAGPYEGEVYYLGEGGSQSILFGTKPTTRSKTIDVQALPQDGSMEPKHARLDWVGDKRGIKIKVTNESKGGETFIGDTRVKKDLVAFPGGSIIIGDTILKVVQN